MNLGSYSSYDCGLCLQLKPSLEKLYFLKNKSQSRVVVEVDLTTLAFAKAEVEFRYGDIRQFICLEDSIYTINCKGVIQIYAFKSKAFTEVEIHSPGTRS